MAGTTFDLDDLRAAENRRKEAAVKAGASPRAERYAMSPIKELMIEMSERQRDPEQEKLNNYLNENPIPGYNMIRVDPEKKKDSEKNEKDMLDLIQEANDNEYKVTDTSTGLPKVAPRDNEDNVPAKVVVSRSVLGGPVVKAQTENSDSGSGSTNQPPKPSTTSHPGNPGNKPAEPPGNAHGHENKPPKPEEKK